MPMIWGILNISLNCPNAVNTLKEVWILTEMNTINTLKQFLNLKLKLNTLNHCGDFADLYKY